MLILTFAALTYGLQGCNQGTNTADDSVEYAHEQNESIEDAAREGASEFERGINLENNDDAEFAVEAVSAGLAEINAGKVAQEKATNPRVKEFSAQIVEEYTRATDELKTLAEDKNIVVPTAPGENELREIADLNAEEGAEFDKEYINLIANDQNDVIDLYENAVENVDDPEIREFASRTLALLKANVEEAKTIEESLE